jgi:hypothetical protein
MTGPIHSRLRVLRKAIHALDLAAALLVSAESEESTDDPRAYEKAKRRYDRARAVVERELAKVDVALSTIAIVLRRLR